MKKKCIRLLVLVVIIVLAIASYRVWLALFDRIKAMNLYDLFHGSYVDSDEKAVIKYSEYYKISKKHLLGWLDNFKSWSAFLAWLLGIPSWLFSFVGDSMLWMYYLSNAVLFLFAIGLVIYISSNPKYRKTKGARFVVKVVTLMTMIVSESIGFIKAFLRKYKHQIKQALLLYMLLSGILEFLILEFFLYIMSYFVYMLTMESFFFLLRTCKVIIIHWVMLYFGWTKVPAIIVTIILIFKMLMKMSWSKLQGWHNKFKCILKYDTATVNVFNGAPGTGKTLSIVQAALANTENFIEELQDCLIDFEMRYPEFNLGYIRLICSFRYEQFTYEDAKKQLAKFDDTNFLLDFVEFILSLDVDGICDYYYKLWYRGSFNASSIGVLDPYNYMVSEDGFGYTHHLDFKSIRFYQKQDNMFHEPYENLIIPEFDKEYASNDTDTKKNASDDGAPAFFAMFSHLVKREGKIFLDWQAKSQALKRFRDVAGFFCYLTKSREGYAGFAKFFRIPIMLLYRLNLFFIKLYLGEYKYLDKWSLRHGNFKYKRNDVSMFYQILKYNGLVLSKALDYFEHFRYKKIWGEICFDEEERNKSKIKYYIPYANMYHKGNKLYESCQFNRFYADLRSKLNAQDKGLEKLTYWTSIDPGAKEYVESVHQRYYTKIYNAQNTQLSGEEEEENDEGGVL